MGSYALAVRIGEYVDNLSEREHAEINRVIDIGMQLCNAAHLSNQIGDKLFTLSPRGIALVCEVRQELITGWAYNIHNPSDRVPTKVPELGPCICGECHSVS